jgi:AraC family transcriptional regulator
MNSKSGAVRRPAERQALAAKVSRDIEANPAADWSVDIMAASIGMSPFHFIRSFKATMGLTPYAFVRHVRLREATRLLTSTRRPILEVALECGFADLSTFNHAFRANFGRTPTEYRR